MSYRGLLLITIMAMLLLAGCQPAVPAAVVPADIETPEPPPPPPTLVTYEGVVEHIFIHPLLAFPEQAFDGDSQALGFDDWFITVSEFNRILPVLHERGFILVDINEVYEQVEVDGKQQIRRRQLMLPEGKKPLILSIDDLNYYKYMRGNGTVHRLVLDEKGEVATWTELPDGTILVSRDNECIPILDEFVRQHPDFSHNGAKGTIAVTGYEGILGYRSDYRSKPGGPDRQSEIDLVKPVIARLKETGWNFASHSYAHNRINERTLNRLIWDTRRWQDEVAALVGDTQVYIYPFGIHLWPGDPKLEYLMSQGFTIFCSVGNSSLENILPDGSAVLTDRRHVDGISLRRQRTNFLDLYDSDEIIDLTVRPQR